MFVGLFSDLGTTTIDGGVDLIRTSGFSTVGKGAAFYVRDPEQTARTAKGQALVNGATGDTGDAEAAVDALENYFRRQDDEGNWWTLNEEQPTSDMFGTIGDGAYSVADPGTAGTAVDSTASIQALFDYCIRYSRTPAYVSAGIHRVTDVLHIGYGDTFVQLIVRGAGAKFDGAAAFVGSAIVSNKRDRPTINVQGGRTVRIENLVVAGYLGAKITAQNMGLNTAVPGVDDTDPAQWDDATFSIADSRYKPYAGICIDGYGGTDNSQRYPAPTRPAWVPRGEDPYETEAVKKGMSSGTTIANCDVQGFTVAVMVNPSNDPTQSDFTLVTRSRLVRSKYLLSVGGHQSRNVSLEDCDTARYYCALTNRIHGDQTGKFGGTIKNCGFGAGIDLIDLDGAIATPVTFLNCYCEAQWRIGRFAHGLQSDKGLTFQDCELRFLMDGDLGDVTDGRGIPGALLYNPTAPTTIPAGAIKFVGGSLYVHSVAPLIANCQFEGTSILQTRRNSGVSEYERQGHNALAGGLVLPQLNSDDYEQKIAFEPIDLGTGGKVAAVITGDGFKQSDRSRGTPVYVRAMRARDDRMFELIPRGYNAQSVGKTQISYVDHDAGGGVVNWVGPELTMEWSGATRAYHGAVLGIGPGGVMLDTATGAVMFIRSAVEAGGKLTFVGVLQNNIRTTSPTAATTASLTSGSKTIIVASATGISVGMSAGTLPGETLRIPHGTYVRAVSGTTITLSHAATATASGVNVAFKTIARVSEISLSSGSWYVGHCRYYTLPMPHLADFTASSSTISNVKQVATTGVYSTATAQLTGNIEVDDNLFLGRTRRPVLTEVGGRITAFNNSTQEITVNGVAAFSAVRERLDRFIRALPDDA